MKSLSTLFLIIALVPYYGFGQSNDHDPQNKKPIKYNTWLAGGKIGVLIPYVDIMDYDFFPSDSKTYKPGWSVFINKQISPFVGLQAQFTSGNLFATKSKYHFESSFIQYGVNANFSITDLIFTNVQKKRVNLFFQIGIGLMDFRTIKYLDGNPICQEGYKNMETLEKDKATSEFIVPISIGANFNLSRLIDLSIETSLNNLVSSDKLDCTEELRNDKYGFTSIGISFKIGNSNNRHLAWVSTKEKLEFEEKLAKKNKSEIELLMEDRDLLARKVAFLDSIYIASLLTEDDDDNDGVPNSRDLEPETPYNYLANFQGIGIAITDTVATTDTLIDKNRELLLSIYFDFNSFEIKTEDNMQIAEVAKKLKANPHFKIEIRGHADKVGNEAYNRELSRKRTIAVYNKLVNDFGIDPNKLIETYKGKGDLLSVGDDYINRRVDFIILK